MKFIIIFIEICAGAGGLSSGLISAGLKPILLNDLDKDCCNTLKLNHPDAKIIQSSINHPDAKRIQSSINNYVAEYLANHFHKLENALALKISVASPKMFMIENVKGLLTHNKGQTLALIIKELELSGKYNIVFKLCSLLVEFSTTEKRASFYYWNT